MNPITDHEFLTQLARAAYKDHQDFKQLREFYEKLLAEARAKIPSAAAISDNHFENDLAIRIAHLTEIVHSFQCREGMAMKTYGRICHHFAQNGVTWESEGPTLDERY